MCIRDSLNRKSDWVANTEIVIRRNSDVVAVREVGEVKQAVGRTRRLEHDAPTGSRERTLGALDWHLKPL